MNCPLIAIVIAALALGGCASDPDAGTRTDGADARLARCGEVQGTLAVDDGRQASWWRPFSGRTGVTSIAPLVRLLAERSGCFIITAIGNGRTDPLRPRAGRPRRATTDYFLEAAIALPDREARPVAPTAPATATLLLVDVRRGQHLATPTGAATALPYAAVAASLGEERGDVLEPYERTADGRAAVAALVLAFNRLVTTTGSDGARDAARP